MRLIPSDDVDPKNACGRYHQRVMEGGLFILFAASLVKQVGRPHIAAAGDQLLAEHALGRNRQFGPVGLIGLEHVKPRERSREQQGNQYWVEPSRQISPVIEHLDSVEPGDIFPFGGLPVGQKASPAEPWRKTAIERQLALEHAAAGPRSERHRTAEE